MKYTDQPGPNATPEETYASPAGHPRGTGPESAGQSGDTQGLSDVPEADGESVEELVEEGQSYEAQVIAGIENAPDPDVAEVYTHEVPQDNTPAEYLDQGIGNPAVPGPDPNLVPDELGARKTRSSTGAPRKKPRKAAH
jgi:hypothetical protein